MRKSSMNDPDRLYSRIGCLNLLGDKNRGTGSEKTS